MQSVDTKEPNILNNFLKAPNLKINSQKYPFANFEFLDEKINESNFEFPRNSVIGMQAEACFEAYLTRSEFFNILSANLQIPGEKETLGELDYIVRNLKTKQVVHIELACKFYLYDDDAGASEEEKWIGPNRKDSFNDKLEKIKLKQFPLLYKYETIRKLEELEIEIPNTQELCLKAFLFLPNSLILEDEKLDSLNIPTNYTDCVVGHWIRYKDFLKEDNTSLFAIPAKKEWLLPLEAIETWNSFPEVKKLIEVQIENKKSSLIYKKGTHKIEHIFVVWW